MRRLVVAHFLPALVTSLVFFGCGGDDGANAPASNPDGGGSDVESDASELDASGGDTSTEDVSSGDGSPKADAPGDVAAEDGATTSCIDPNRPLPIVPCGAGFGTETPAGSGRHLALPSTTVYRVTTLEASGPGSLEACVNESGPRVCVFEVSGVIERTSDLRVKEPFLTVAGQTAPSPGISIHGAGLRVEASDVLISHVRIRVGDRPEGPPVHNRDAIGISVKEPGEVRRVVIDHCSMAFSSDEMLSVWYTAGDITVVDSLLGFPLHESIHVDEVEGPDFHGLGPLFGPDTDRITMSRNVLAHHFGRNPLSRTDGLVMINNYIYNWRGEATVLGSVEGSINRATVVGNLYVKGPNSNTRPPIRVTEMPSGSSVFVDDNEGPGADSNPWTIVENLAGDWVVASSPPVVHDGYYPDGVSAVPDLLDTVGAWPSARDAVDQRIVQEVREGTGTIINCVEDDGSERCSLNAGGWPTLAENQRELTLPDAPNEDDDGDGYTNLENWLHSFVP